MRRRARGPIAPAALLVAVGLLTGCAFASDPRQYESPEQVQRLRTAELEAVRVGPLGDPERSRRELAEARVALLVAIDANAPEERQLASARRVGEAFVAVLGTQPRIERAAAAGDFGRARGGSSSSTCIAMADAAVARWDGGVAGRLAAAWRLDARQRAAIGGDLRKVATDCSRAPGEQRRG